MLSIKVPEKNLWFKSILILIFSACLTPMYGQTTDQTDNIWISLGLGMYSTEPVTGVSIYTSANWKRIRPVSTNNGTQSRELYLKMRIIKNFGSASEDYYQNFWEFGLLYGKSFGTGVQFIIAGGIGAVKGYESISDPVTGIHTEASGPFFKPGIPVEIGLMASGKNAGLGVCAYADFNSRWAFYGVSLNLLFGRIR